LPASWSWTSLLDLSSWNSKVAICTSFVAHCKSKIMSKTSSLVPINEIVSRSHFSLQYFVTSVFAFFRM
jgi:hypothetical protein